MCKTGSIHSPLVASACACLEVSRVVWLRQGQDGNKELRDAVAASSRAPATAAVPDGCRRGRARSQQGRGDMARSLAAARKHAELTALLTMRARRSLRAALLLHSLHHACSPRCASGARVWPARWPGDEARSSVCIDLSRRACTCLRGAAPPCARLPSRPRPCSLPALSTCATCV